MANTTQSIDSSAVRKPKLGDMLVEEGLITADQLKTALKYQMQKDVKLGEALVSLGLLTEARLKDFLSQQDSRMKVGHQLVESGRITPEQLQKALDVKRQTGKKLGRVLVDMGILSDYEFSRFLAEQIGVPFTDLAQVNPEEKAAALLSEAEMRRLRVLPLRQQANGVVVAMVDPTDLFALDELAHLLKRPLVLTMVLEKQLRDAIDRLHNKSKVIQGFVQELGEEVDRNRVNLAQLIQTGGSEDAPVVRILQAVFEEAISLNASDIHIEPGRSVLRIRKRIDGHLYEQIIPEKQIAAPLISKLKLMAGMEIAERRRPQDGRFNMVVGDTTVEVRMSSVPIQEGESVVMRLFNQSAGLRNLDHVGFPPEMVRKLRSWLTRPHGIILVTGPTGSGKTTTLYAALNELNEAARKIITVEDPVEFRIDRVNQIQVNAAIDLTFANVLRSMLRQDPDVMLVGEMRDHETAEIAVQAALTGHLVLSTLHTNDALSTAIRLLEMGVKGFAVASSLVGVLSQRLVRKLCSYCQVPYRPTVQEVAWLEGIGYDAQGLELVTATGCTLCNRLGFSGRLAVGEFMEVDLPIASALRTADTVAFYREAKRQRGYLPLHLSAMELLKSKQTTVGEVFRLAGDSHGAKPEEEAV